MYEKTAMSWIKAAILSKIIPIERLGSHRKSATVKRSAHRDHNKNRIVFAPSGDAINPSVPYPWDFSFSPVLVVLGRTKENKKNSMSVSKDFKQQMFVSGREKIEIKGITALGFLR